MDATIQGMNQNLLKLMRDVELMKNILMSEGELTGWAKKELAKAREIPLEKCISHEEVKRKFFER